MFIEFNLLQLYHFNKSRKEQSFGQFNNYFSTGVRPGNRTLIDSAVPTRNYYILFKIF